MPSKIYSAQVSGLSVDIVEIEVDISRGLKSFTIVGLPNSAVREAKDRISAAIKNAGFESPQKGNRKVIVSLAPADLKKEGPIFDLGIALANLIALGELSPEMNKKLFLGELGLSGELRSIRGALLIAQKARDAGFEELYLPKENAAEAALVPRLSVFGVSHLGEIIDHFTQTRGQRIAAHAHENLQIPLAAPHVDFCDIKGQESAKRALEIAAAGGHNIAMYGPPGTGKTMLAKACSGILPELSFDAAIEVTGIHSAAGILDQPFIAYPPLRSPHHTSSYVSIVGGGTAPKPGEITLAHRGILFLDEFPEFDSRVIEALRQPLEDRVVSISRAKGSARFPADIMLIATMNPCPCGNRGSSRKECICPPAAISRYDRKLSGPIVDRIDIWVHVPDIDHEKLLGTETLGRSSEVQERVKEARRIQEVRFAQGKIHLNSAMGARELKEHAPLPLAAKNMLAQAATRLGLSARAHHRVIKLARTIADLAHSEEIAQEHILEALQYRPRTSR